MRDLYPEITPFRTGLLEIGEGQRMYWEECGNPQGKPVVFLHGGPGSGCTATHRRLFDPAAYRIVLFDQRGCGRSTPHAASPEIDLSDNTTWHLVADLERLREHLGIERWQVFGGSWGSALALAYAETHPNRVTELVLRGVCSFRAGEREWAYNGASAYLFPDRWQDFLAPLDGLDHVDVFEAYHQLLHHSNPQVRRDAAVAWSRWEAANATLLPDRQLVETIGDPTHATALARIEVHYFRNRGFFSEGQLLTDAGKLSGIPGVIVHGRYDLVTPATTAWELHGAWPDSDLRLVEGAGHAYFEPGVLDQLLEATDRFATR